ncbi:exo-alpha-sialidase [Fodinibius saliphilus]|uniref:exo-alpha-sialidase n=1 Tax=Fodinibius saliphilus TaxID=1920650 RepID=UPI001107DD81|nr:exo-alpha-sialidase [Fodinibius saliphilus]
MKLKLTALLIVGVTFWGCAPTQDNHSAFENPAPENSRYPFLYSSSDVLFMSWLHQEDERSNLQYSQYMDGSWSTPKTIATDSSWFVNWADYPSIIAHDGKPMAAHWLNKIEGGTYSYNVNISTVTANGKWKPAVVPHLDSTATEHGFVSMVPWNESTILAVWLDGRQTANRSENEYYDIDKAMTLRGAIINKNRKIGEKFVIDNAVCDCCQTSLVPTQEGAIIAYRNRTDDEIRDIKISRFDGHKWSEPKAVYEDDWKIAACPVNGPSVVAEGDIVAVAWHTGANDKPKAKVAISTDGANNFSKPIVLNNHTSIGRVDAVLHNEHIYVSWVEEGKSKPRLKLKAINSSGEVVSHQTIDEIKRSRKTGFPRMERHRDHLIFAWTKADTAQTAIITKKITLPVKD